MRTQDSTVATRVPLDLRADLERIVEVRRRRGETRLDHNGKRVPTDLSTVLRAELRRFADAELGRAEVAGRHELRLLDNGPSGSKRRNSTPTERAAALAVAPRIGSQRRRALEAFEAAGDRGLTADEVVVKLAPAPHNGTARRVTDLLQGGLITEVRAAGEYGDELTPGIYREPRGEELKNLIKLPSGAIGIGRRTRAGAVATVYAITDDGRVALARKRAEEAAKS